MEVTKNQAPLMPPASFATLPRELLLDIMSRLIDLRSMYHLTLALPAAYRLFHDVGPELLDEALEAGKDTTMESCQGLLIRLVAMIRSTTASNVRLAPDVETFRRFYFRQKDRTPSLRATLDAPGAKCSARDVLLLARRVSCLAADCFDFFYDGWSQIRPQHLVDQNVSYQLLPGGGFQPRPWRSQFEGYDYQPDLGPPSPSADEARTIHAALWHIQIVHELQRAAAESRLPWPETDLAHALSSCPFVPKPYMAETMRSMLLYFRASATLERAPGPEAQGPSSPHRLPRLVRPAPWPAQQHAIPAGTSPTPPGIGKRVHHLTAAVHSPFRTLPAHVLAPIGLAIWDVERLVGAELMPAPYGTSPPRPLTPSPNGQLPVLGVTNAQSLFTWRSLLRPEDLVYIIDRQEQELRDGRYDEACRRSLMSSD